MQTPSAAQARQLDVSRQAGKYNPALPLAFRIAGLFGRAIENIFIDEHA